MVLDEGKHRALIREFQIRFMGPTQPQLWPDQYKDIFSIIRTIGRQEFDSYQPDEAHDLLSTNATKERTERIVRTGALDAFWTPANEATLRYNIEGPVLARFTSEIKCRTCRDLLWKSEFRALPNASVESARLQRARVEQRLCNCTLADRTWDNFEDLSETFLFSNVSQQVVESDPDDDLQTRGLQKQSPDRVLGLNFTKSFQHYAQPIDGVRHTPFLGQNLLYPFLVIEAKAACSPKGFANAETQSAFPLRTCLKLQEALKQRSGQPLSPLVWYMAYKGDEWRLSACVKDERYPDETIFDLWMGRTSSWDGSLQLLHIIDFICDWARTVYRKQILVCLAGGKTLLRRYTPHATEATSQDSQSLATAPEENDDQNSVIGTEIQDGPDLAMDDADDGDTQLDLVEQSYQSGTSPAYTITEQHPWLTWTNNTTDWTTNATIRHTDMVSFRFTHLALPETRPALIKCLRSMRDFQGDTIESIARDTLKHLMNPEAAITTTAGYLSRVRSEWLKTYQDSSDDTATILRTWFSFITDVRKTDWQIERGLWCITCSLKAAHCLAAIAGMPSTRLEASLKMSESTYDIPLSLFTTLRSFVGHSSLSAAINTKQLFLSVYRESNGQYHCAWAAKTGVFSPAVRALLSLFENALADDGLLMLLDEDRNVMEVVGKPLSKRIAHLLPVAQPAAHGAILLRKGRDWPASTPTWCLMVMKELDFENQQDLSHTLARVKADQDIYTFVAGGFRPEADTFAGSSSSQTTHERFLDAWIASLASS